MLRQKILYRSLPTSTTNHPFTVASMSLLIFKNIFGVDFFSSCQNYGQKKLHCLVHSIYLQKWDVL